MTNNELLPCKKCGYKPIIHLAVRYWIKCHKCQQSTDGQFNYEDAINEWNKRQGETE